LKTAVEVFQDVISYESNNGKEFKSEVRVRKYMHEQAKTINRTKQLIVPKNRGRKPKVLNATENASQMGRTPLARDA
jgi:hypothetical protein